MHHTCPRCYGKGGWTTKRGRMLKAFGKRWHTCPDCEGDGRMRPPPKPNHLPLPPIHRDVQVTAAAIAASAPQPAIEPTGNPYKMDPLNLIVQVWVKLTPYGVNILQQDHVRFWSERNHPRADLPVPGLRSDNWLCTQLWVLMHTFGARMFLTSPMVFEHNQIHLTKPKEAN